MAHENQRVKELRKEVGLTMEKFGALLGVGRSSIANIESGARGLTEQMINSICKTDWNGKRVNETWLRTGEGDMFLAAPANPFDALAQEYGLSEPIKILIEEIVSRPELERKALSSLLMDIANKIMECKQNGGEADLIELDEAVIQEKLAMYRESLELEAAHKKSEASSAGA